MTEIDRGGSEAAHFGADDAAEGDEVDATDTVEFAFFVFGVGCRIGVFLLDNFAAVMKNTNAARVITVTTDIHDVDDATYNAVVPSCPFRSSPAKMEKAVVDYLDVAVRLVMIYEFVEFYVIVTEEAFGITVDTGFELSLKTHEILGVFTTIIFAFKLCSQVELWHKELLKILGRGLRAFVAGLRCVARALGRGLRASVTGLRCVARALGKMVTVPVILLWAAGKEIVYAGGLLMAEIAQRWQTLQRDNNNDYHNDEEPIAAPTAEPVPSPVQVAVSPSATETSNNMTPRTLLPPEATPEIDTDHVTRRRPDRSCRSPTHTVPPQTPPRTPPEQQGGAGSIANEDDGDRRSTSESLKGTTNMDNAADTTIAPGRRGNRNIHPLLLSPASAPKVDIFPDGRPQTRPTADDCPSHVPTSVARGVKSHEINTPPGHKLVRRLPVRQGGKVHCCTVDPLARKEIWVHAQYFEDIHGEAVPGVFTYLPVTLLRPSFSEFSTDGGRKWYVQPGGKRGRKEWSEEDERVVWEVPQARTFEKVSAEPDDNCDACRRKGRQCSWTPDRLECLCDYCADAPRRHLYGYGHARDLGFNWARACDCLGQ